MYSIGRIKYWYRVQTATVIKPIHLFHKIKKIVRTVMASSGNYLKEREHVETFSARVSWLLHNGL